MVTYHGVVSVETVSVEIWAKTPCLKTIKEGPGCKAKAGGTFCLYSTGRKDLSEKIMDYARKIIIKAGQD